MPLQHGSAHCFVLMRNTAGLQTRAVVNWDLGGESMIETCDISDIEHHRVSDDS